METYRSLVYSICLSFTKNPFDAEDLAQETFLAAYAKLSSFDGNNFKAWIATISANKCRDFLRKQRETEPIDGQAIADPGASPERIVMEHLAQEHIYKLCKKLKEPYQTVAVAYFCEDQKLSDMAKMSGRNLKTLQTQLYRAKKHLARLWKEESG